LIKIEISKEKADVYINQINSQVKTVPSSEQEASKYSFTIQSLIDFSKSERKIQSAKSEQQQNQIEFEYIICRIYFLFSSIIHENYGNNFNSNNIY